MPDGPNPNTEPPLNKADSRARLTSLVDNVKSFLNDPANAELKRGFREKGGKGNPLREYLEKNPDEQAKVGDLDVFYGKTMPGWIKVANYTPEELVEIAGTLRQIFTAGQTKGVFRQIIEDYDVLHWGDQDLKNKLFETLEAKTPPPDNGNGFAGSHGSGPGAGAGRAEEEWARARQRRTSSTGGGASGAGSTGRTGSAPPPGGGSTGGSPGGSDGFRSWESTYGSRRRSYSGSYSTGGGTGSTGPDPGPRPGPDPSAGARGGPPPPPDGGGAGPAGPASPDADPAGFKMPEINLKEALKKLSGLKVFGQPLSEIVAGAVASGVIRHAAKISLTTAGIGGFGLMAGVGAVGGALIGFGREIGRQYTEKMVAEGKTGKETEYWRASLKDKFRALKPQDKKKLAVQTFKGAAFGALGGVIGGGISEFLESQFDNIFSQGEAPASSPTAPESPETADASEKDSAPSDGAESPPPPQGSAGSSPDIAEPPPMQQPASPIDNTVSVPEAPQAQAAAAAATAEHLSPAEDKIAQIPTEIKLESGSNPWAVSRDLLIKAGVTDPSNAQIMEMDKALCQASKIAVPNWGISGDGFTLDTRLPVGYEMVIDDSVRETLSQIAGIEPTVESAADVPQMPISEAPVVLDSIVSEAEIKEVQAEVKTLVEKEGSTIPMRQGETFADVMNRTYRDVTFSNFDQLDKIDLKALHLDALILMNWDQLVAAYPGDFPIRYQDVPLILDYAQRGEPTAIQTLLKVFNEVPKPGSERFNINNASDPLFWEKISAIAVKLRNNG